MAKPPTRPDRKLIGAHGRDGVENIVRVVLGFDASESVVIRSIESLLPIRIKEIALQTILKLATLDKSRLDKEGSISHLVDIASTPWRHGLQLRNPVRHLALNRS